MMRPRYCIVLLIAGAISVGHNGALASGSTGNLNFVFGQKQVDDQDWMTSNPGMAGIDVMWGDERWPVMIEAYAAASGAESETAFDEPVNEYTNEFGLGLAKVWGVGHFHPYLAGGFATITGTVQIDRASGIGDSYESKYGAGGWASAGGFFRVIDRINLGALARFSAANASFQGDSRSLGGWQYGLVLGWAWPSAD
jgi:hypothetical protein